ncbi:bifunctional ornithine acetyltransferase/N-acetylglutamate synthase, partial [Coprococcus eutactus]
LVKAALFGQDANWGRIMGAIGATDADLDVNRVDIKLNGINIVLSSHGVDYDEWLLRQKLAEDQIKIDVDLH